MNGDLIVVSDAEQDAVIGVAEKQKEVALWALIDGGRIKREPLLKAYRKAEQTVVALRERALIAMYEVALERARKEGQASMQDGARQEYGNYLHKAKASPEAAEKELLSQDASENNERASPMREL